MEEWYTKAPLLPLFFLFLLFLLFPAAKWQETRVAFPMRGKREREDFYCFILWGKSRRERETEAQRCENGREDEKSSSLLLLFPIF